VFGIYLNTDTSGNEPTTEVSGNTIRDNNVPGATNGNGIYSDQGAKNVKITNNTFTGQQNYDVLFGRDPAGAAIVATNITVANNSIKNSGGGVQFVAVTNSKIENNTIENSALNGILLDGGNTYVVVRNNTLKNPGILGGFHGILLADSYGVFGENERNTIEKNAITAAGLSGITIRDSNLNTIKSNTVTGSVGFDLTDTTWGNGISLIRAENNTVESNSVSKNARNGIFVDADSTGNKIKSNTSTKNAVRKNDIQLLGQDPAFDYRDDTDPPTPPTSPTENAYSKNKGKTQNRNGLIQSFS
jgi:parallel beta-helix repeat protein